MLPPIEKDVTLSLSDGASEADAVAAAVLVSSFRARAVDQEGGWSVYAIGSRAKLRIWGLWGAKAYRRLPLKVHMRARRGADQGWLLDLRLVGDEGAYLVRLPTVEPAYQRAFREIVACMKSALHPQHEAPG